MLIGRTILFLECTGHVLAAIRSALVLLHRHRLPAARLVSAPNRTAYPRIALPRLLPPSIPALPRDRIATHLVVLFLAASAILPIRATPGNLDRQELDPPTITSFLSRRERPPEILRAPTLLPSLLWPRAWGKLLTSLDPESGTPREKLPPESSDSGQSPSEATGPKRPIKHVVVSGDTVSGIAERFGISVDTVLLANGLANPDALQIGDELLILPTSGLLHIVAEGDSLNYLASAYGVTAEAIAKANGVTDAHALPVGMELMVPEGRVVVARAQSISRGGRLAPAPAATGSFRWPAGGSITQSYHQNSHRAIDIAASHGSPVYAADGGVVVTALKTGYDYGWHLVIDHGNGFQTLYAHLSAFLVDYGERVSKGEHIASMGDTGLSFGPHLHFELHQNGVKVNPLKLLP